jgi:selenocysteine lyase/cysteine desulfurase
VSLDLRVHFSIFRGAAPGRIHLAAHSHHYWPDVAVRAHETAAVDAARLADRKWEAVFETLIPNLQRKIAHILKLADPATLAFAPNTHEFVCRLLSALPLRRPARVLTTDAEFHSFQRQIARLEEDGLVVVDRVAAEPAADFSARFAAHAARNVDLVFVSQVFFNSGASAGDLDALVASVASSDTLVVIDGYHGFMALPTDLSRIAARAFYLAGGYKYAMAGEGACLMHCPPGIAPRPRDTGWYAAMGSLSDEARPQVAYAADGSRFVGATFDPSGLYRMTAVFDWMDRIGLSVDAIHAHAVGLQSLFLDAVARASIAPLLEATLITPLDADHARGNFLAFETREAGAIHDCLAAANIITDVRGSRIRIGFGCYHAAEEIPVIVTAIRRALQC